MAYPLNLSLPWPLALILKGDYPATR